MQHNLDRMPRTEVNAAVRFENGSSVVGGCVHMKLFVAGDYKNSRVARANLDRFCVEYLAGRAEIEIVDVTQDPRKAQEWRVLLTPTLLVFGSKGTPARITGTLQEPGCVLSVMGLNPA
jgi:circadian clock protein KaiB